MSTYSIALFVHIVGALVLFAALTFEWVGLRHFRNSAHSEQIRAWLGVINGASKTGFPSMFVTVITGVYMMVKIRRWTPWLAVTIGGLALMIILARAAAPRLKTLGRSLETVNDPLLWVSVQTRSAIALGIIFLKIVKPDWIGSLLTIGIAVVLGIGSAFSMSRHHAKSQAISTD